MEEKQSPLPEEEERAPQRPDPADLNAVEKLYERFRGVPLKYIDIFIGVCVALLLLVVVLGMLKGWGVM